MPTPNPTVFLDAAYAALAHPGRRAILHLLYEAGPLTTKNIAAEFPRVSLRAVREHLRCLRRAGLATARHGPTGHADTFATDSLLEFALRGRFPDARDLWHELDQRGLKVLSAELAELQGAFAQYAMPQTPEDMSSAS